MTFSMNLRIDQIVSVKRFKTQINGYNNYLPHVTTKEDIEYIVDADWDDFIRWYNHSLSDEWEWDIIERIKL